jgi:diaminopimelate epimerase
VAGQAFVKGHGTENDFVLLPDPDGSLDLRSDQVRRLCDRRAGIGADGVLRVVPSVVSGDGERWAEQAEWFMDYRNADGSLAEMCGNGIRVFGRFLVDAGLAAPGRIVVGTRAGLRWVEVADEGDVVAGLGPVTLRPPGEVKVRVGERSFAGVVVDVGNPHVVVFVDDLADAGDLREPPDVSPPVPGGVNVEFVAARGPQHIAMRVHERGSGETRSCGTGAVAASVAAARRDGARTPSTYVVDVPGGRLEVTERADGHAELRGPAVLVARGEVLLG